MLRQVVTKDNTRSDVWVDSAYRSKANEAWLSSQVHHRKSKGRPMSVATSRANGKKPSIRAGVKDDSAHQKNRYGLFIRTIGLATGRGLLTLAKSAYNMDRFTFYDRRIATK